MAETEFLGLQKAWFSKLPAHLAADALKERNERRKAQDPYDCEFAEVEQVLLQRNDPLIDLALARYGLTQEVLGELYSKSLQGTGDDVQDLGVRVAILSNKLAPGRFFEACPAMTPQELARLLNAGTGDEIKALLTNPATRVYVGNLYCRKEPFDAVDDDRFHTLVRASVTNPRLHFNDSTSEGPDFHNLDIQKGIYQIVSTVPATSRWLWTIDFLLFNYLPASISGKQDVFDVIQRWRSVEIPGYNSNDDDAGHYTKLKPAEEFCCRLAAVFGSYFESGAFKCIGTKDSPDIVLRCAFYGNDAKMTPKDMQAAYEKDGAVFSFAALHNSHFYWNRACRVQLESMLRGYQFDLYEAFCKKRAEREKNFDATPASEDYVSDESVEPVDPWSRMRLTLTNIETLAASAQKDASTSKKLAIFILVGLVVLLSRIS
jgi:hypothetical protein